MSKYLTMGNPDYNLLARFHFLAYDHSPPNNLFFFESICSNNCNILSRLFP